MLIKKTLTGLAIGAIAVSGLVLASPASASTPLNKTVSQDVEHKDKSKAKTDITPAEAAKKAEFREAKKAKWEAMTPEAKAQAKAERETKVSTKKAERKAAKSEGKAVHVEREVKTPEAKAQAKAERETKIATKKAEREAKKAEWEAMTPEAQAKAKAEREAKKVERKNAKQAENKVESEVKTEEPKG